MQFRKVWQNRILLNTLFNKINNQKLGDFDSFRKTESIINNCKKNKKKSNCQTLRFLINYDTNVTNVI